MAGDVRIGISGWTYGPWRGTFYPQGWPQKRELAFAAGRFRSIEINGSFYSLQTPRSYRAWYDATPDGFVFAVKGGRYITHLRRLKDVRPALANFFASGVLALREKLGPILWQLPPTFKFDANRLAEFFDLLPRDTRSAARLAKEHERFLRGRSLVETDARRPVRHALEVRHESFSTPAFVKLLRKHDIAVVVADTAGKWPLIEEITSDFVYVRLHGDEELYVSGYTDEALDAWSKKIRRWRKSRDVYVYFDNDVKVRAPADAHALAERLGVSVGEPLAEVDYSNAKEPARTSWPPIKRGGRRARKAS
jgi:uncharacterized protein YecE (DUF72 family)